MNIVAFNIIIPSPSNETYFAITLIPLVIDTEDPVNETNIRNLLMSISKDMTPICNEGIKTLRDWMHARVTGRIISGDEPSQKFTLRVNDLWPLDLGRVRRAISDMIESRQSGQKKDYRIDSPLDKISIKSDLDPKLKLSIHRMLAGLKVRERYPDFYERCIKSIGSPSI